MLLTRRLSRIRRSALALLMVTMGVNSFILISTNNRANAQSIQLSQTAPLTLTALQNISYNIPELDQVTLTNGVFKSADESDIVVRMSKQIAIGSLKGNNVKNAAATVLWVTQKGAKPSFYLAVVLNENGQLNNVDTIPLLHGFSVKSLSIQKGLITVKMLKYSSTDAPCCPSQETSQTYFFNESSGKLIPSSVGLEDPNPGGVEVKDIQVPEPIRINNLGAPGPANEIEIKF